MGPRHEQSKDRGPKDPPRFTANMDLDVWRMQVSSLVHLVGNAVEKGSDNLYKTVFAAFGRQLYDSCLTQAQMGIANEAQLRGLIDYKQEDQVKAVNEIVDLIAADPPIDEVTRLIDFFNQVSSCRKRRGEDLKDFVSGFQGLAAKHLMHAGATS